MRVDPIPASEEADFRPPDFTDEALARRFTDMYLNSLQYVSGWGHWLHWNGAVWRADKTLLAFDMSRKICRRAAFECDDPRIASKIASAKTVAAVERLARADRKHAATVDQWDRDPWLLNTPGGVVDLRVGETRPHRPGDYMTKITAVAPGGNCPLWLSFLCRVSGNDKELVAFLQRVVGYCLTGVIREHALFFIFGNGGNGKSVFLNTLTALMGGYGTIASMDVFTASAADRHPADLAMFRGARLVTAQETDEGRHWAESRIKTLTGGDPITARFMRQDFFTFHPTFKILIAGNHKPSLRSVDDAMRRRLHLIPFCTKITREERDPSLLEKLRDEWPGILAWAIAGCLAWQSEGLKAPTSVTQATDSYLEAEDAISQWIADCCQVSRTHSDTSANLFASWTKWAIGAGETAGSQKRFAQLLEAHGFTARRQAGTGRAGFVGLSVGKSGGV